MTPPAPAPVAVSFDADLDRFIDNLTIKQARALLDKLKRAFA